MIETQVLMTLSNFLVFFSRNHFLEGASLFSGVVCFSVKRGGVIFKGGGGGGGPRLVQTFCGGAKKVIQLIEWPPRPPPPPPTMGNPGQFAPKKRQFAPVCDVWY